MIAGPPPGGRPSLTDAKPLVLAGAHSRAGLWVLAGDMVLMGPLALLAWSGFDDGLTNITRLREAFRDRVDGVVALVASLSQDELFTSGQRA